MRFYAITIEIFQLKCVFTYLQEHRVNKQKRGKLLCLAHGNTLILEMHRNLKINIGVAQFLPPSDLK